MSDTCTTQFGKRPSISAAKPEQEMQNSNSVSRPPSTSTKAMYQ